jgi:hypothetical protein
MQIYSVPVHTGQLLCQQAKQVHITSFLSPADAKLLLRPPASSVCLAADWG